MLSPQSLPPTERQLYSKLRQILTHPGLLRGGLSEMRRTCGNKSCHCVKGGRHKHRSLYLATSLKGKSRLIYIPAAWEERVREWVSRHSQVRDVLEQLSLACLRRLQAREE